MIVKLTTDNKTIYLSEETLKISNEIESSVINCTYKERFNTLITLFDLQRNWKDEDANDAKHLVYFNDNENEFTYKFSNKYPKNFLLFLDYLTKLIGENV